VGNIIGGFSDINPELIGEEVMKSGIATEVTTGEVTSITTSLKARNFNGTEVTANNMIMVKGNSGSFSASGDSGSAVFTTNGSLMIGVLTGAGLTSGLTSVSAADAILSQWSDLSF
jgi:hypothetical protein